jgi:ABC-type nitrate/sulfonate/bicarbonate transport system substrate-binding protein
MRQMITALVKTAHVLRLSLLLGGAFIFSSPVSAEALRVGKAVPKSFSFSLVDLGVKAGIFKANGLDLEIIAFGGGARLQQALAAKSVDIGFGGGVDMGFIPKGSPITGVAAMAGPPDLVLAVRPDGSIAKIADLKDKKVSVSSPSAVTGWMMRELARQQSWDPDKSVILVGNAPQAGWAAMRTKEVDGIVDNLGAALEAEQKGYGRILTQFRDHIRDFHMYVIFASNDLIDRNPDAIRAFLKGWFATVAYARAHRKEMVDVAAEVTATERSLNDKIYEAQMSILSGDGKFRPAALETIRRSFVDLKILNEAPDMAKLYTEKFLPAAPGK